MREIVILIPDLEPEQNVLIDVSVNGRKKAVQYRVELITSEEIENSGVDRVTVLKHKIEKRELGWELVEIGAPGEKGIPLTFRKVISDGLGSSNNSSIEEA